MKKKGHLEPIKRAFVGLSGGVDSAVSAALLKEQGYDVTGVFIKVWQPDWIECTWKEDRRDAMRVAAHLNIPFVTLDLVKEYKQGVIDYMLSEYEAGRTPNPDVMCNREVKFGAFWRWAEKNGADFIATGHYARNEKAGDSHFKMLAGVDLNKDQSYFLWTLNQRDLKHVLFPVGGMIKPKVRELARRFKLPNSSKKDSQGLCFIGKIDVQEFLKHYIKTKEGDVIDSNGKVIGKHPGALLFTIGQRYGFSIQEKSPNDPAYFVVSKDIVKNTITVSGKDSGERLPGGGKTVRLKSVNWVSGIRPAATDSKGNYLLQGRSRYRQPLQSLRIVSAENNEAVIEFKEKQDTLTEGQSLVIYDGEECLGGGVIS